MPDLPTFATFAVASLILLVTPGPAVLFVVARGVELGQRGGIASALGLAAGNLVWALAAAVGIAGLIAASQAAFTVLRVAGGAYLIYLGLSRLRRRDGGATDPGEAVPAAAGRSLWRPFRQGLVVNVLNPKLAVFFVAFLPPFIDPGVGPVWSQALALGVAFTALGLATDGAYAVVAAGAGRSVLRRATSSRIGRWFVGGTYLGLGVLAIASADPAGRRS